MMQKHIAIILSPLIASTGGL